MEELKPCPFCGSKDVGQCIEGEPGHECEWIQCSECNSTAENVDIWNRRADK